MKVSYIYWEPWFGGKKPPFRVGDAAELSFGYRDVLGARVVVAHAPSLLARGHSECLRTLRHNADPSQLWLLETHESTINYPVQFEPSFRSLFDEEISFRQQAGLWAPYLSQDYVRGYQTTPQDQRLELCCSFVSSPVNKSGRREYMEELLQHIPVASFGRFLRNRTITEDHGQETKLRLLRDFRFTLAFENAVETDYVTEKFFEPLMVGTIPVYLGAPNVEEFAPGADCYIDARQFPNPKDLAAYLQTVDPRRFHRWRHEPLKPRFLDMLRRTSAPFEERFMALVGRLAGSQRQDRNVQP